MKTLYLVLVSLSLLVPTAFASDGAPPEDISAKSPNGRYGVTVKYDHELQRTNTPAYPVISLTDTVEATSRNIQFPRGLNVGFPRKVFVTDNGDMLMSSYASYYVFKKDDQYRYVFNINDTAHALGEKKTFCEHSSFALEWNCRTFDLTGFITYKNKLYFYISMYWGRIFIIDIEDATLSSDSEVQKAVDDAIINKTIETIQSYNGVYVKTFPDRLYFDDRLNPYIFTTEKYRIQEGKALIEALKRADNRRVLRYLDKVQKNRQ